MISENLIVLREKNRLSQEDVAEAVNVSRQTVAKWESGASTPDIQKCDDLSRLFNVTVDNLLHYSERNEGMPMPTKGKHVFGLVTLGEKGQVVIPKKCRDMFNLKPGDSLLVLGDEKQGIGMVKPEELLHFYNSFSQVIKDEK